MVLLLASDHVHRRVEVVLGDLEDGGPDVLADVEARAVGPQHRDVLGRPAFFEPELGLRQMVDRVAALVCREDVFPEPLGDDVLAERVGVRLVVEDVEVHPETPVGRAEPVVDPLVHALPEAEGRGVAGLPLFQHLLDVRFKRGVFFRLDRVADVPRPDEVVAFHPGRLRGGAVSETLPGEHALADVHPAVVDQDGFDHPVPGGCEQPRHRDAQGRVAQVPQVQGLVGVGREILHHHAPAFAGA